MSSPTKLETICRCLLWYGGWSAVQSREMSAGEGRTTPSSAPHERVQGRGTWGSSRPYSVDPRRWHARVSARAPEMMHGVGEHLTTPCKRRGPCEGQHQCGAAEESGFPRPRAHVQGGHKVVLAGRSPAYPSAFPQAEEVHEDFPLPKKKKKIRM